MHTHTEVFSNESSAKHETIIIFLKDIFLFQIFLLNMDEEVKRCSTEFGIHLSVHRFAHLNQVIFPRTNRIPLALFIFLLPVLFLGVFLSN